MKNGLIIFSAATGVFIILMLGIFMGRNHSDDPFRIYTENSCSTEDASRIEQFGLININTATHAQLTQLPGIGPTLAQRIIDYREEFGPFDSVQDLCNVSGIGEKLLAGMIDFITVGG